MNYLELARLHEPVLLLLAPLIGAALALMSPGARVAWAAALVCGLLALGIAGDLAMRTLVGGDILVATIEGVALRADDLALYAAPLVALCLAFVLMAIGGALGEINGRAAPFALALLLCVAAGWIGALLAADLIGVLVGAEAAFVASIGLVALNGEKSRGAINGALRMFAAGGVGAALTASGAALVYRGVGSLDLSVIAAAHIDAPGMAAMGAGLVILGLALKAGVAPLHMWLGAAFGRAGAFAALGVGVVGAVGAAAALARVSAYLIVAAPLGEALSAIVALLGGASVVIGSMQAVGARNILRLSAYAGVAQIGCILLCVALGSPAGFAAALVQITAFAAAAMALFGGAAVAGVQAITELDGVGRRAPLAGAAMTAGAISLMGAPLLLGFLGRWRLVEAGVGADSWWAAGAVIFASLAGVFYGGRIVERLYFRRAAETYTGAPGGAAIAFAPMLVGAIVIIAMGLAPGALLRAADAAAALMMGAGA
ncbi:MAG: proton-conducting transporter membrane subunit [Hyphomonadaceae bacterium]